LVVVNYRDVVPIDGQRIDCIVARLVILEIKAVSRVDPIFEAKLISYLRATKIKVGLLMNVKELLLKDGIRRRVV
jgi:GxxExxY protein